MFTTIDDDTGYSKYITRSRAVVLDNLDPEAKGRIIVSHPLLGDTVWIPYLMLPGVFSVPQVGDIVYLECDSGFETHPIAWGNLTKGAESTIDSKDLPEVFQRVNPSNKGMFTPDGHLFEMDDGTDIAGSGSGIRHTTAKKNQIHIQDDVAGGSIIAEVNFGDRLELSGPEGFLVTTPAAGGTSLSQKSGKITLTSAQDTSITSTLGTVKVKGKIAIGNEAGELLDLLVQQLDALINNAPTFVSTSVGPGVLNPAVVTTLTTIKTTLSLIKGSL